MTDHPLLAVNACDHHYEHQVRVGHPLTVSVCLFCRTPDWADLREQVDRIRAAEQQTCGSRSLPISSGEVVRCVLDAGHDRQCQSATGHPYVSWPNPSNGEWHRAAAGIRDAARQASRQPAAHCMCGHTRSQHLTVSGRLLCDECESFDACREYTPIGRPAAEEMHVVTDDSDDPEHVDDCPGCEVGIEHTEHCPTPETHNWGCGCPTDQRPAEQSTSRVGRCPVMLQGGGRCEKNADHRPPGSDDPHTPEPAVGVQDATQPTTDETEQLVHVGWWCWRGDNNGHLTIQACRSDNVPIHVPTEWADDMRAVIQRIEDGDEPDAAGAES